MRVLIVGGGIAGPVLAAFLRRIGADVLVCESRDRAAPDEGAFLGVAPNGMNVLAELGAADAVRTRGTPCRGFAFLNAKGERIGAIDGSEDEARHGAPLVIVRRGDLHEVLLDTAQRAGATVRFGARLVALDQSDPSVVAARFEDGREELADLVVGCDGLRSRTRALALPSTPAPEYIGLLDFAGYAHVPSAPLEVGCNVMLFGHRAFFGAFRRPDGEIFWFHNSGSTDPKLQLDPEARRAHILAAHAEDPEWIRDVVRATPEIRGPWPLHDIMTIPRWHAGRVAVIGDAAHATSPSGGQGASLAMEDAMLLARCVRDEPDPERAFARLEQLRRGRVERIVAQSRRNGSPKAITNPIARWARDRMLPTFLRLGAAAQREVHGYRIDWSAKPS